MGISVEYKLISLRKRCIWFAKLQNLLEIRRKMALFFQLFSVFFGFAHRMFSKSHLSTIRVPSIFQHITIHIFPYTSLTERNGKRDDNSGNEE